MDWKLIIFVVFANLVQFSFAQPLNITYGLPDKERAVLGQIITNQNAGLSTKFEAVNPLFDVLEKYASVLIYNLEAAVTDDDSKVLADATAKANVAHDYAIDSIQIAVEKSCAAVEEARTIIHAIEIEAYQTCGLGLSLAASGNYSANRSQMEAYRDKLLDLLRNHVQTFYNTISTCLQTTDDQVLGTIEVGRTGSRLAYDHATYAIFNGIITYAAAVSAGNADVSLISRLEDNRENLLDAIRADAESKFSLLRALYINSNLVRTTSILRALHANQYAQVVSNHSYQAGAEVIFDTITAHARRLHLGLSDAGEADFSPIDAARALALAKLTAGYKVILEAVLTAHPDAIEAVAATRKTFAATSADLIFTIFHAIDVVRAASVNHSEAIRNIEIHRLSVISYIDVYVESYFSLLRSSQTLNIDTEAQFIANKILATEMFVAFADNIFAAVKVLADISYAAEATPDDSETIQKYQALAYSALENYTQCSSAASLLAI